MEHLSKVASTELAESSAPAGATTLTPFQRECVIFFVNAAAVFSVPRSIGQIYGLVFATEEPLTLDDIVTKLEISRGSASGGLRWLRGLGAIQLVCRPGMRKDSFTAETSLRRLAAGVLRDQIEPHLENGPNRLEALRSAIDPQGGQRHSFERDRLHQVQNWYRFVGRAMPLVKSLAKRF